MKIVADNKIPFLKGALDDHAEVIYLPNHEINQHSIAEADALIVRTRTICNEQLLKGTRVKFIATATIGFDHIDTIFCEKNGIFWTNAPGCNSGSVKQYFASALAYIIDRDRMKFHNITLGIIGAGHVGSKIEMLARALGIKTLVNDPPRERNEGPEGFVGMEQVLSDSDIITLHVPLQIIGADKTLHMADASFLNKMKHGAWLINTSRGEVVETKSLIHALKSGHLRGAIIDVWEHEPNLSKELLQCADIATPHIAGYSADGKANGTAMSVQAVSRFFGLGMDDWIPNSLPQPDQPEFSQDCEHLTTEEFFIKLAYQTYNIENDSFRLKGACDVFEKQRENYPVRREPFAFKILIKNPKEEHLLITQNMGFDLQVKDT